MHPKNLTINLSVIIPALHEQKNLSILLPELHLILQTRSINYEIIIVTEYADYKTRVIVQNNSCILLTPDSKGYGAAIKAGIELARGSYILTMDADLSHSPDFISSLWEVRQRADIIVASRYVIGGKAIMPLRRLVLSKILNQVFSRGLDLKIRDMSSGYRLYEASTIKKRFYQSNDFDVLQEILVNALIEGYNVLEIPFTYQPRQYGSSHARVFKFGLRYLQAFYKLWRLRNSIASADYDARAFVTFFPPQRYWQHQRFKHITKMIPDKNKCLDVGCGSSRILDALPNGSIGLDIQIRKLRYSRRYNKNYVNGSATALPIASESIKCIVCSQVIEHIPRGSVLSELDRVLSPKGLLILGTPDYSKWEWVLIEKIYKLILPHAYADEHITHYSYREIIDEFVRTRGYTIEDTNYILNGELIIGLRKQMRI